MVPAARGAGEPVLPGDFDGTPTGFGLAIASGAVATGFGYIVWYLALRDLSAAHAATVQLSMPAVTALGGSRFWPSRCPCGC